VDDGAADLHRLADRADGVLRGAADPDPARPDRQTHRRELLRVADGGVDEQRRRSAGSRLGREQLTDEGDRRGLRHRQHDHLAGLDLGHDGVGHEVVVLAAAHCPRRAGGT
jgi:hypothetical protein